MLHQKSHSQPATPSNAARVYHFILLSLPPSIIPRLSILPSGSSIDAGASSIRVLGHKQVDLLTPSLDLARRIKDLDRISTLGARIRASQEPMLPVPSQLAKALGNGGMILPSRGGGVSVPARRMGLREFDTASGVDVDYFYGLWVLLQGLMW
jgi:hypothetical protein